MYGIKQRIANSVGFPLKPEPPTSPGIYNNGPFETEANNLRKSLLKDFDEVEIIY